MFLDFYVHNMVLVYNGFVLLAYNIMHCSFHLLHLPCDQVQQDGEEKTIQEAEPFEPMEPTPPTSLQVGWNVSCEMDFLCQAERHGFLADVHADSWNGCSPGHRLAGKDHGTIPSCYNCSNHCQSDHGGLQRWWWKRKSRTKVWRWCQTTSSP